MSCYYCQGHRESRGDPGKSFHARSAQKYSRRGQLINGVWSTSKCLSTLTVKVLLIILPKCSLIESRQCNGKRKKIINKQRDNQVQKGKKHANKSLMGPLKSLGALRTWLLFLYTTKIQLRLSLLISSNLCEVTTRGMSSTDMNSWSPTCSIRSCHC